MKSEAVYKNLFKSIDGDRDCLTEILTSGVLKMKEKLASYAKDQLLGGCYWETDVQVEAILREIKPSNDLRESILGLNDYLTTAGTFQLVQV